MPKVLLTRNPTGFMELVPLKEDGFPDYQRAKVLSDSNLWPKIARDFGWSREQEPGNMGVPTHQEIWDAADFLQMAMLEARGLKNTIEVDAEYIAGW